MTRDPWLLCQVTYAGRLNAVGKRTQLELLVASVLDLTPVLWGDSEPPTRPWGEDSCAAAAELGWLCWSLRGANVGAPVAATIADPWGTPASRNTTMRIATPAGPDVARDLARWLPLAAAAQQVAYAHLHVVTDLDATVPAVPNGLSLTATGDGSPYLNVGDAELDGQLPDVWWGTLLGPDLTARVPGPAVPAAATGSVVDLGGQTTWWRATDDPWDCVTDPGAVLAARQELRARLGPELIWSPPPSTSARSWVLADQDATYTVDQEVLSPAFGRAVVTKVQALPLDLPSGPALSQRLWLRSSEGHEHSVIAHYARLSVLA